MNDQIDICIEFYSLLMDIQLEAEGASFERWWKGNGELTYVYFVSDQTNIKIGITNNIKRRVKDFKTSNSLELSVLFVIPCPCRACALYIERKLHAYFKERKISNEWYDILDYIDPDIIQNNMYFDDELNTYIFDE